VGTARLRIADLSSHAHSFSLVTSALRHFLRHALDTPAGHPFVDKLLMSLIFHCKGDVDQCRAIKDVADGLEGGSSGVSPCRVSMLTRSAGEAVARSDSYELEKLPATACLTVHQFCLGFERKASFLAYSSCGSLETCIIRPKNGEKLQNGFFWGRRTLCV
jgi:hypothetical protein